MPPANAHTLPKKERLYGKSVLDKLFGEGSRSMSAFPIRAVYRVDIAQEDSPQVRVMVTAPKRNLKHAVDRNRVKRLLREAYRRNKTYIVNDATAQKKQSVMIAFIWLDKKLWPSYDVERKVTNLLQRISEKVYGC